MDRKHKKRLIIIIIIAVIITLSLVIVAITLGNTNNDDVIKTNSVSYIYDDTAYIPEPTDSSVEVPDDVYWEPMIGAYVSNELKYNPETKAFEEILDETIPITAAEDYRQLDWWENEFNEKDEIHMAIKLMIDNWVSTHNSMETILEQEAFQKYILPLGAEALDDLLYLAIDKNIFNKMSLSAVGVIGEINCTFWFELGVYDVVAVDDYYYHHEVWKVNFIDLMTELKHQNIDRENIGKYGVFILPYLKDVYKTESEWVDGLVTSKFNIESIAGFKTASSTKRFFAKNRNTLNMLSEVIGKYGN